MQYLSKKPMVLMPSVIFLQERLEGSEALLQNGILF